MNTANWRPTDSDLQLLELSCAGDSQAFDAIVQRHKHRIYHVVYRMVGDREWGEDITLEVFLEAYRSKQNFRHEAQFLTWLYRLTVNVCLENLRRRKAKLQVKEVPLWAEKASPQPSPEASAITRCLAEQITAALQWLSEEQRAVLVLFYLEEQNCAAIAKILGIPRNTVKTRLFYGTRALRDLLGKAGLVPKGGAHGVEV